MGILQLLGVRPLDAATEEYHAPSSLASLRVADRIQNLWGASDQGRVAIAAVYRGAQLLEDLAAQLPWNSWRGGKHSDQATLVEPELVPVRPPLLVDPSPFMTRDEVIRALVASLVFRGRGHLHLQHLDADGRPRFATPVHPDEVSVTWNANQTIREYRWRHELMVPGVNFASIDMLRLPGAAAGIGPLDAARKMIDGVVSTDDWSRALFTDSAVPSLYLSVPGKLTRDEAMELRGAWDESHQGGRGTGVVSGGMAVQTLSMTPEQAQFLGTRAWGVQEVARLLGIPQHFLNAGNSPGSSQSLTYTNVQAVFRELTMLTLYPTYLRRIEAAFSALLPRGQEVQFDLADLLKADDGTRYTALATALGSGILTLDEARAAENLPPVTPTAIEATNAAG